MHSVPNMQVLELLRGDVQKKIMNLFEESHAYVSYIIVEIFYRLKSSILRLLCSVDFATIGAN